MKTCTKCLQEKPLDSFGLDNRKVPRVKSWCRACDNLASKQRYQRDIVAKRARSRELWVLHKEKHNARRKSYRDKDPVLEKAKNRTRNTGFTPELFKLTLEKQHFLCGVCGVNLTELLQRDICADHCHSTKKTRGVLCRYCNLMLGHARDSVSVLRAAIRYLEDHSK